MFSVQPYVPHSVGSTNILTGGQGPSRYGCRRLGCSTLRGTVGTRSCPRSQKRLWVAALQHARLLHHDGMLVAEQKRTIDVPYACSYESSSVITPLRLQTSLICIVTTPRTTPAYLRPNMFFSRTDLDDSRTNRYTERCWRGD